MSIINLNIYYPLWNIQHSEQSTQYNLLLKSTETLNWNIKNATKILQQFTTCYIDSNIIHVTNRQGHVQGEPPKVTARSYSYMKNMTNNTIGNSTKVISFWKMRAVKLYFDKFVCCYDRQLKMFSDIFIVKLTGHWILQKKYNKNVPRNYTNCLNSK